MAAIKRSSLPSQNKANYFQNRGYSLLWKRVEQNEEV